MKEGACHPRLSLKDMTLCECKADDPQLYTEDTYTFNRSFQAGDVMGLLWAAPVRADKLGAALEKYLKCKPRFMKRMIALYCALNRISKSLPREIFPIIEQHYYQTCLPVTDADNDWHLRYHCAQGTCTEFSHVVLSKVLERYAPKLHFANCPKDSSCQSSTLAKEKQPARSAVSAPAEEKPEITGNDDSFNGDSTYGSIDSDESTCTYKSMSADEFRDQLEDYILEVIKSGDGHDPYLNQVFEQHLESIAKWKELINKGPCPHTGVPGNFVKLDKVCTSPYFEPAPLVMTYVC
jgi:hypothetical protein